MSEYRVVLVPEDDGGFSVSVPALPGCFTQGDTRDEALSMAKEAIALHLESLREHGEPVPLDHVEVTTVEVSAA
ncbi:MAG TPA: type II toxin-antitoxin system HicB family antitoxin [Dehalococcoidia bacterium]|nr:type II toxin-antitoxin system HicB family antitoxin [Dehalococcoidia bacterium]